jgi:hypothetical protein
MCELYGGQFRIYSNTELTLIFDLKEADTGKGIIMQTYYLAWDEDHDGQRIIKLDREIGAEELEDIMSKDSLNNNLRMR